jgi:hypothetical protein
LADAQVVERLPARIDGQALEHDGVALELVSDLVSVGGRETAKLDIELSADDPGRPARSI